MGLLSDPEYGSVKWVRVLKKVQKPVCFLCYVGALAWFVVLGNREFNNETYFSENALLPGLVTNEFNGEQSAKQYYAELQQELEDKYEDSKEMPVPWLVARMSQLHLEVYTHNFTLNFPLGQKQVFSGTNVYGILRAARTPSLEALVVSAPYRPLSSIHKGTTAGIALMLAFAEFARPQKYWAKDIIFLITEHEQLGMQAWLEAYHGLQSETETFYSSLGSFWKPGTFEGLNLGKTMKHLGWGSGEKCLDPGKLKGRSGSIQAAINLELHTPKIKYIEVKVEGLNGQLPNLDLVNLVHKLCVKSGIHHSYRNSYSWIRTRDKMEEWMNGVRTMLGMVTTQLTGVPNGNHGLFHRFGIEAVTLEGRDADDPETPPRVASLTPQNFYRLAVTLEAVLRSLNNLLERFHQSYFFYLLAATNRFISIGQYMPSLCLLCLAMLVRALSLWVTIQQDKEEKTDKQTEEQSKTNTSETGDNINDDTTELKHRKHEKARRNSKTVEVRRRQKDASTSILNIGANYIVVHMLGYVVMNSPILLSKIGVRYFFQPSDVSIFYGFLSIFMLLLFVTPYLPKLLCTKNISYDEMTLVNILLLIELATVCLSVGMHNFSLGFALGVAYAPLALTAGVENIEKKRRRRISVLLKRLICVISHPLILLTHGLLGYSMYMFPEDTMSGHLTRGLNAATGTIMFTITDSMIYGNWLYNLFSSVLLPIWIIFWQILTVEVKERPVCKED